MAWTDVFKGFRRGRRRAEPPRDMVAYPQLLTPS
jgi:hypothetical protein